MNKRRARPYRKTKRAESEERTRLRITESAVALHGSLGPALSPLSAIAQHAGVPRSTLYRHFPDEKSLFAACSAHWRAANPAPDLARWAAVPDFAQRLSTALQELYAYYRRTEPMLTNIFRDEAAMPAVREQLQGFRGYLAAAQQVLVQDQKSKGASRRLLPAAVGHVLSFAVWRSLAIDQGIDDRECARLMGIFIQACREHKTR